MNKPLFSVSVWVAVISRAMLRWDRRNRHLQGPHLAGWKKVAREGKRHSPNKIVRMLRKAQIHERTAGQ